MHFEDYQARAVQTAIINRAEVGGQVELALGLNAEAGSVSRIFKKVVRDNISVAAQSEQLRDELGDVLWYVAVLCDGVGFRLEDVAAANLDRTRDRYRGGDAESAPRPADLEGEAPPEQRFPRKMTFQMRGLDTGGLPHSEFSITRAEPNHYPNGPEVGPTGKPRGFALGAPIGDLVNDNADEEDGYRFHDAVHLAFMAVVGWSPVMRALLGLKRKYNDEVDRNQDGARARDLEEALSALLMSMSQSRNHFQSESDIDGETRDIIRRVVGGLEVRDVPIWLWARAIQQGFSVMGALQNNGGGWVTADLDQGLIAFHREDPDAAPQNES